MVADMSTEREECRHDSVWGAVASITCFRISAKRLYHVTTHTRMYDEITMIYTEFISAATTM